MPSPRPRARRVVLVELGHRHVVADVGVGAKDRAFGLHLVDAALEVSLLHLELGDAVAQQATDAVGRSYTTTS